MGNGCHSNSEKRKEITYLMQDSPSFSTLPLSFQREASVGRYFISDKASDSVKSDWLRSWEKFQFSEHPFARMLSYSRNDFLKKVRRGVPAECRWQIWQALAETSNKVNLSAYARIPIESSLALSEINKDVPRTFPDHPYFNPSKFGAFGQPALRRVLGKLVYRHPDLGYCQSMNYLAGFLLIVSSGDEAGTFYMMESLLVDFNLEGFFAGDLQGISKEMWVFQQHLKEKESKVALHLKNLGVIKQQWIFKWFLTVFTESFKPELALRIWDFFLAEKLVFLHKLGLTIVKSHADTLLSLDPDQVSEFFAKIKDKVKDIEKTINQAYNMHLSDIYYRPMKRGLTNEFTMEVTPKKSTKGKLAGFAELVTSYFKS